ncbi:energy transducer TonB [Fulvivirga ulvae]|uniref:energy transducer TonB n=1 Tax=Fulvivirga ulvae TaxID=2904245 RepID=UPI001F4334EA|nr:energy transducer TonB [Fulvivirga ulvae]UII32132.1 energy transducer TonB [Fulvivirga ulvae]
MKVFIALLLLFNMVSVAFSQYTIYYNERGEITLPELATHYRIAKVNVVDKHFVGKVLEYRMDSSLILEINYDDKGFKKGEFRYVNNIGETISTDHWPSSSSLQLDSLLSIINKKKEFAKATYIRRNDYPDLKPLLIDKYVAETTAIIENEERVVFVIVEDPPQFPGGMNKFAEMLGYYLVYPNEALDKKITGKVYVQFVINGDGTTSDVKVLKGIGAGCDEAAEYAVRKMPDWRPGYQRGKAVPVKMVIPITFN